jgi:hypothetical protein
VGAYSCYVYNGELRCEFPLLTSVRNDNISLKIYTPHLEGLHISGNTDVTVGSGLNETTFQAAISGSGKLDMKGGAATNLYFYTSGDALIFAEPLYSQKARATVSGSAKIEMRASQTLDVAISGSGEVHYWGNPVVASHISGSGKTISH